MAQLVVRNLEDDVKVRLQRRAKKHGCSLEELVRDILRDAANDKRPTGGLGSQIAALFKDVGFENGEILEWRGYPVQPAKFDE
jgi:antitoxin FitA